MEGPGRRPEDEAWEIVLSRVTTSVYPDLGTDVIFKVDEDAEGGDGAGSIEISIEGQTLTLPPGELVDLAPGTWGGRVTQVEDATITVGQLSREMKISSAYPDLDTVALDAAPRAWWKR